MAASLASIAETWPENVKPPIGFRKSLTRKIRLVSCLSTDSPDLSDFLFDQAENLCNLFCAQNYFFSLQINQIYRIILTGQAENLCNPFCSANVVDYML